MLLVVAAAPVGGSADIAAAASAAFAQLCYQIFEILLKSKRFVVNFSRVRFQLPLESSNHIQTFPTVI